MISGSRNFNPRPLAGATFLPCILQVLPAISIHAPLRGRRRHTAVQHQPVYFNPRPLAGATNDLGFLAFLQKFQSTPPCGGDLAKVSSFNHRSISIHAPLRGRPVSFSRSTALSMISIHAPLRGRHVVPDHLIDPGHISIHAPLRGRLAGASANWLVGIFQSTPPCGGDPRRRDLSPLPLGIFQSTPPCGGDEYPYNQSFPH